MLALPSTFWVNLSLAKRILTCLLIILLPFDPPLLILLSFPNLLSLRIPAAVLTSHIVEASSWAFHYDRVLFPLYRDRCIVAIEL